MSLRERLCGRFSSNTDRNLELSARPEGTLHGWRVGKLQELINWLTVRAKDLTRQTSNRRSSNNRPVITIWLTRGTECWVESVITAVGHTWTPPINFRHSPICVRHSEWKRVKAHGKRSLTVKIKRCSGKISHEQHCRAESVSRKNEFSLLVQHSWGVS